MQAVLSVKQNAQVKRIAWHRKGDYVSTVSPTASTAHVIIHQVCYLYIDMYRQASNNSVCEKDWRNRKRGTQAT